MTYHGEALRRAAEPTFEAIGWLEKKVPPAHREVLDEIRERLFDPGYTVGQLKEALRLRSHWVITSIGKAAGVTLWRFIRECRLETAARLLRDTSLDVLDVALLVGYDSEPSFSELFQKWCGQRPRAYRRHARAVTARLGLTPEEAFPWSLWQSFCDCELGIAEGEDLISALEKLPAPCVNA